MIEGLIALALGVILWVVHWIAAASPELVFKAGVLLVAAGLALGVPTGLVYHLMLYRSLRRVDALPARWWLHPTSLHHAIPREDRGVVLGWCYVGALGFVVIMVGLTIGGAGGWRLG